MKSHTLKKTLTPLAAAVALLAVGGYAQAQTADASLPVVTVVDTAEQALKQAPGVSIITAEDLASRPPANDLSEIIRTMPGVNLTGNSTSGQRGNNRQIDLRGMGPENTLVLIDGKPVTSRDSVRMGRAGERDTRGDSNWVPAEQVEEIEVIRGPAAARYGNGAAGGVVNIITKKPTETITGQVSVYANAPTHSDEGATQRMNFSLSGPVAENLSFRLWGNVNHTEQDGQYINQGHQAPGYTSALPAGNEGVNNKDLSGQLLWKFLPDQSLALDWGYSRQGNLYAGDNQNVLGSSSALIANVNANYGDETNIMQRQTVAVTHKGKFDFGTTNTYLQVANTTNTRLQEGLAGGGEGVFTSGATPFVVSTLKDTTFHTDVNLPIATTMRQMLTLGAEYTKQELNDPTSTSQTFASGTLVPGLTSTGRSPLSSSSITSFFAEDNIELSKATLLTPGLRYDDHSQSGTNWSPSLNLTHALSEQVTLKGGIARAYKAPNLYQSDPNYLLLSSGNGCRNSGGCYLLGNANLQAETSVNKEIGIEYKKDGFLAGVTYFQNDYHNKIEGGSTVLGTTGTYSIYQWTNIPSAVVRGLEGTLHIPLSRTVDWSNNFTYMIESKNKSTGDALSIIPKYTINSTLDWQATDKLSLQATATFYGEQKPVEHTIIGTAVTGTSAQSLDPYSIVGVSGKYAVNNKTRVTLGVSNLFDKRLFREGNANTPKDTGTSAGAATYNEHGRTLYVQLTQNF
jgi:ferric enterobactin receptor